MRENMPKVSALVMIYNEAPQIRDCLETIKWVDEIVICDSFSNDGTVEICREYTDKIYQREFDDFGSQKNWTLDKPSHEWVLFVEADERFSAALTDEIRFKLSQEEGYDGYYMPFENYCFRWKLKGYFWQFKKLKLFKKGKVRWEERMVHSGIEFSGRADDLENPVIHLPYRSFRHWLRKINYSSRLHAQQMFKDGTGYGWQHVIRVPLCIPVVFCRFYFKRADYKSGLGGVIVSLMAALTVSLNYYRYFLEKGRRSRVKG